MDMIETGPPASGGRAGEWSTSVTVARSELGTRAREVVGEMRVSFSSRLDKRGEKRQKNTEILDLILVSYSSFFRFRYLYRR